MRMATRFLFFMVLTLFFSSSAFASGICPQPRKTKSAPAIIAARDQTATADLEHGKVLYMSDAKPIACVLCHGAAGDGTGKSGVALIPPPPNFTCKETMQGISAGQMFYITKEGSIGTGMTPYGNTMSEKDIWDVIKYIQATFMK